MGYLGLAQPLALSSPLTNAQLPFPLFIGGNEVSQGASGADALTYRLRDPGFQGNQQMTFTIHDHTNAVYPWIAKQQRVIWSDAVNGRYLFQGFVKNLGIRTVGPWLDIDVTCVHMSEGLDFALPITTWDAGRNGSDQAAIQALVGNFATELHLGSGGFVQNLGSIPGSVPVDTTTLRTAIDAVLQATGVQGVVCYVDNVGYLHTLGVGDVTAPYNISDHPNLSTSVPALLNILDEGANDVDGLYVNGATAAGSGIVRGPIAPRDPMRWAVLDAPQATTTASRNQAALVEFYRRQNAVAVQAIVTGFDGWQKGQLLSVTNGPLGWAAKQFTINAVDMDVISGKGLHRYTLTLGTDPVLLSGRVRNLHARWSKVAGGARLRGRIGGALP